MTDRQQSMNSAANAAKTDHEARNRFIAREELHIKKLTARILKKSITESDDEYAIALSAVNEAIDRYDEAKGDFWLFASYLIKNRIYDFYRKENLHISQEIPVEEKPNQTAVTETTSLKDEIEALSGELSEFGVDFFAIAKASPTAKKTKKACMDVLRAFFLPPPLVRLLRETKKLPKAEIKRRVNVSEKILERYRGYLILLVLIADGDYPQVREYVPFAGK